MSRGPDNQQTIAEARRFLSENRQTIVTVFKRHAKIGGGGGGGGSSDGVTTQAEKPEVDLRELVKNLVLLISVTDYLNVSFCLTRHHQLTSTFLFFPSHPHQRKQRKKREKLIPFIDLQTVRRRNQSWSIIIVIDCSLYCKRLLLSHDTRRKDSSPCYNTQINQFKTRQTSSIMIFLFRMYIGILYAKSFLFRHTYTHERWTRIVHGLSLFSERKKQ